MDPQRPVFREFDLTPEVLGQQGRALRGLARSLLGDAHAAEDVVQETWLACLKHPGALPERVSAWLGTVTKHLALRRKRGERRLRTREERAALPERLEALQQRNLEREEALRAVTQALLALEEPFKTALLLRYYEDRTPNEIALELGEPLSTVKSRLARGLEKLRAKLGREFAGDETRRTRALLALAGLPSPSLVIGGGAAAGPTASTIGTLMGLKLQAAVVALVLAGGALWWWNRDGELRRTGAATTTAPERVANAALSPGDAPPSAVLATEAATSGDAQREAVATAAAEPDALEAFPPEASYRYVVRGQVRGAHDLPLAGARVFLAPRLFPFNHAATTDDEGRFTLEFDGRRPTLDCALAFDDGGGTTLGPCAVHLVASQPLEVDVGLNTVRAQGVQLFGISGGTFELSFAALEVGGHAPETGAEFERFVVSRTLSDGSGPFGGAPEMLRSAGGVSRFVDPPPARACLRSRESAELHERGVTMLEAASFYAPLEAHEFALDLNALSFDVQMYSPVVVEARTPAFEAPPAARVRGIVRDADGNALTGVEVGWGPPGRGLTQSTESDEHGAFALADLPPGELRLRAGGGDHGRAEERVTLVADQDFAWNPLLERGDEVAGRVLSAEKKGLANLRVELWSASASYLWCDSTLTNEDGRFAIPNVPPGTYELHVYTTDPESAFPVRVLSTVFARSDLGEIVLAPAELVRHTLEVAALDAQGAPLPGAELRVWSVASGRAALVVTADEKGVLSLAGLPNGAYRVELGSALGWRDLGTTWVEEDLELGAERFAAPGVARLALDPAGDPAQRVSSSLWSAHPDVFGSVEAQDPLGTAIVPLRAGAYVLCARAGSERRAEAPLDVTSGAATAMSLLTRRDALEIRAEPFPLGLQEVQQVQCAACHSESMSDEAR